MDLRGKLTEPQTDRACAVLGYQPFIITDDLQTGAAYSWVHGVDLFSPTLVFDRRKHASEWERIADANGRQRQMYDDFVMEIARRYPGGSLLDFGCNNGYFPVKAELMGMRGCRGVDGAVQCGDSVGFLNHV